MPPFSPRPVAAAALGLALLAAASASATSIYWNDAAGGAATLAGNWSPAQVPGAADVALFPVPATFATSWAAPADTLDFLWVTQGNPNFTIADRLGMREGFAIRGVSSLTLSSGTIWSSACYADYFDLGQMIVTGTASELDAAHIEIGSFGGGGPSRLDVANGGRVFCRGPLYLGANPGEVFAGSIYHRVRSGFPFITHYPVVYTLLDGNGQAPDAVIGGHGAASLDLYDGGYLNTIGRLFFGAYSDGAATVHCYPNGGAGSGITSNGETWIGGNLTAGVAGGAATVKLEGSFCYFTGPCHLGDPDDPPGGPVNHVLQLDNGAYTVFGAGLSMNDALTSRLDVIGGDTHVIGGPVVIKQVAPFEVGSAIGHAPTLTLQNGTTDDIWPTLPGTAALGIGRAGTGKLAVSGAGSVLTVHGALAIADSTGGAGTLTVDSTAAVVVQGHAVLGGAGAAIVNVKGLGTVVTMQDSVAIGASAATGYGEFFADSSSTAHFLKPVTIGSGRNGDLLCFRGAHMDVAGASLSGSGLLELGGVGSRVTVSDHLDMSGNGWVAVDSAGTLIYTNAAKAVTVGPGGAAFVVNNGALAQLAGSLDVLGNLLLESTNTIGLMSAAPGSRLSPARPRARPATPQPAGVTGGRIESPLVRLHGEATATATGTIAGRFHMDSGDNALAISYNDLYFNGHLIAGDSTKTDGFSSIGITTIGLDTLVVLDSDGGDLGKMTMAGGLLQLPKPGHLRPGMLLTGSGTVQGSLDARDSAWVSFHGQITGDLALAGTLDLGSPASALVLGSFHPTATARTSFRVGHLNQDLLVALGAAALGGTLDLRSVPGDAPVVGDTFTVISAGSLTGTFAKLTFNGRPAAGVAAVLYRATDVRVAITGAVTGVDDGPPAGASPPAVLRFAGIGGPREAGVSLELPTAANVRITLYDVTGRQLATLADGELPAGRHRFELGRVVGGSGMYFARAEVRGGTDSRVLTTRAVVLR